MKLSKRLETVASFVKEGSWVADVGTDHGYIPIALIKRKKAERAIAMDVRQGPLKRAREHIREMGLEEKIETRLCDGVEGLASGEADTVIIAGMGGELVIHIMEKGTHLWDSVKHWILSPQSELDKVRKFLGRQGFAILKEDMVEEDGKYYTIMDVAREEWDGEREGEKERKRVETDLEHAKYLFGPRLIEERNPVLLQFLKKEEGVLGDIVKSLESQSGLRALDRKRELEKKLSWIRRAIKEYEMQ